MVTARQTFDTAFARLPLVAILRGVHPDEVLPIADALLAEGFGMIEVPLNSPEPFVSIERLVAYCPVEVCVGAGTVLTADDARRLADTGATMMVTPNYDPAVVDAAVGAGLAAAIGCMTPSEAFAALARGAAAVKIFPAARLGPAYFKDLKAVLPPATRLIAVGGAGLAEMAAFTEMGCDGFGFGSNLYRPGRSADEVGAVARDLVAEWRRLTEG